MEARRQGIQVTVATFPWKFSGRALTMGAPAGPTKMVVEADSRRVIGMGITGRGAEDMIAEGVLADDVPLSMHAHPTPSKTQGETVEIFLGLATLILPRK